MIHTFSFLLSKFIEEHYNPSNCGSAYFKNKLNTFLGKCLNRCETKKPFTNLSKAVLVAVGATDDISNYLLEDIVAIL